jgi:hypothetical protein
MQKFFFILFFLTWAVWLSVKIYSATAPKAPIRSRLATIRNRIGNSNKNEHKAAEANIVEVKPSIAEVKPDEDETLLLPLDVDEMLSEIQKESKNPNMTKTELIAAGVPVELLELRELMNALSQINSGGEKRNTKPTKKE